MAHASEEPRPVIVSGFSSQKLANKIAVSMGSRIVKVTYKQFKDKEIQTVIEENVRGRAVIVVASASGDPNKQEKEARLIMRAVNRSGAKQVCLFMPYMWYGRSDDIWDERNAPALTDTIETLRPHCDLVLIADPHNASLTREKFLDMGSPVKNCTVAHFAYPFALQLKAMIADGTISKENLLLCHADSGSTKRISRSFRTCLYNVLGLSRNADQDDWPQGLKDRDKATGFISIKGFSDSVTGKDVVIFEDMISTGGTACDSAALLKKMGARSVFLFATTGLFTSNLKEGEDLTVSVQRVNQSQLDAVFITDTFDHSLTDPAIQEAIQESTTVHVIDTAFYLGGILKAMHMGAPQEGCADKNSVSSWMKGLHPDQQA